MDLKGKKHLKTPHYSCFNTHGPVNSPVMNSYVWYYSNHSTLLLKTDRVDTQRLHVLAVCVTLAGAEVREDLVGEFLSVRVEPGHVVRVIEDEQAFRVVQEHPHLL